MADEIKLKSDIAYNCRNKEIIGFVGKNGSLNLREEFSDILKSPEIAPQNTKVPAVYANQWRFRSIHNKTHNAEFFFNSGSITKDELLRQFMHVVTCYEMSGVKVMGIVPDAGGPNSGLLKLLRKDEKVEGNWPNTACLSLVNHMCLERCISTWHCSTHGAKAMRNSLYRSQESGTKNFRRKDGVNFGWDQIFDIYKRDEEGCKQGLARRTDMTQQSAKLDHWSVMNVSLAKAPFKEKTINEMCA